MATLYKNPQGQVVKSTNPATTTPSNLVRLSPGVFRDTKTGKLVQGNNPVKPANPAQPKNLDMGATRIASGKWRLADGREVDSRGRPIVGQFGAAPTQTTTQPGTATNPEGTPTETTSQLSEALNKFLFPTTDMANDPIHQASLKRGQSALDAKLASMGLSGSGREVDMTRDLITDLETASQGRYLEQAQENAGRLATMMESQANRNLTSNQQDWQRVMDSIRLLIDQNPAQFGQNALNASGEIQTDINKAKKSTNAGNYQRVTSSGGGAAPVRQPVDTSGLNDALLNFINKSNSSSNANDLMRMISGFGSAVGQMYGGTK